MDYIRKAVTQDASRLAEILIFTKRMNYRKIFQDDKVSFGKMQVYPLAQDYIKSPEKMKDIWVYDDEFVKGMMHIKGKELVELYVDYFFQNEGIGAKLIEFAIQMFDIQNLVVLEKMSAQFGSINSMAFHSHKSGGWKKERQSISSKWNDNGTFVRKIADQAR